MYSFTAPPGEQDAFHQLSMALSQLIISFSRAFCMHLFPHHWSLIGRELITTSHLLFASPGSFIWFQDPRAKCFLFRKLCTGPHVSCHFYSTLSLGCCTVVMETYWYSYSSRSPLAAGLIKAVEGSMACHTTSLCPFIWGWPLLHGCVCVSVCVRPRDVC